MLNAQELILCTNQLNLINCKCSSYKEMHSRCGFVFIWFRGPTIWKCFRKQS